MALNNYVAGYGSYPYPQFSTGLTPPIPQSSPAPSSSFVWVQGDAGAKSYPVAPGNRIALFDSENPVVYIKSVDLSGRPAEMEIYDLVRREPKPVSEPPKVDLTNFITRDEISTIVSETVSKEVDRAIADLSLKPASKRRKEVEE